MGAFLAQSSSSFIGDTLFQEELCNHRGDRHVLTMSPQLHPGAYTMIKGLPLVVLKKTHREEKISSTFGDSKAKVAAGLAL